MQIAGADNVVNGSYTIAGVTATTLTFTGAFSATAGAGPLTATVTGEVERWHKTTTATTVTAAAKLLYFDADGAETTDSTLAACP